ncbi:MAG: hypothetical protein JST09_18205 [Bacteroidetes bacterium]|nr:hypothetical protein [Bacteroidota bacterium]
MKFHLIILAFFTISVLVTNAQFKIIAEGPVFEEPEKGSAKILQLKNGNTAFFLRTGREFNLQIYNSSHQKKVEQTLPSDFGKKDLYVRAIFELNNDIVILIGVSEDRVPTIYRWIVDGTTGRLKSNEKLAELSKVSRTAGYSIVFGGVPIPNFFVKKDPDGDSYAIILMNSFEPDRNKRIEIIWYGADNKEISRAYYTSPEEKYKYLEYLDMVVISKERVSILAYAYNTKASGDNEKVLALANLNIGDNVVSVVELPFVKNMLVYDAISKYNPVTKRIITVAATKESKRSNEYSCYLACIDPESKKVEYSSPIYPVKASEMQVELFGRRHPFTGLPQNLYINNDGTISVVFEEMTQISSQYSTHTELGNIAVSKYNANGKELSSCLIPKSQLLKSGALSPFYLSYREGNFTALGQGDQFKSFAYLNGGEKIYILFNDIEENWERIQKGKITTIQSVGDCDGYYYNISGYKTLPNRDFVFGKPEKRQNNLALFAVSEYNKNTNMYVTLKLEKNGREKGVRLVWMQPQ